MVWTHSVMVDAWLQRCDHCLLLPTICFTVARYCVVHSLIEERAYTVDTLRNVDVLGMADRVLVTNQHGDTLEASCVIVTVPLTVLRDNGIEFIPSLPEAKIRAAKSLCMEPAYRIICRFQKIFWPHEFGIIVCPNGFASHIHQDCRYKKSSRDVTELAVDRSINRTLMRDDIHSDGCFMLSGFQTSELAAVKEGLSDEEMTKGFLEQLDEIFGWVMVLYIYYVWPVAT